MVSRRKLEEEIARSKDPVLRKQLQELLEKRSQRWAEKGKKAKGFLNRYFLFDSNYKAPDAFAFCIWFIVIVLIVIALIRFFSSLIGYS
jgi:hypothetical protein